MPSTTLHYIYDPFCGWCYAASPLLAAAQEISGLQITLHGGGMMSGANRQQVTPQLRSYVMQHDATIARMTGQPFGNDYFNGLLQDQDAVFDSSPPITAILAANALGSRGLDLLKRIQSAHYVAGRRIADYRVLQELAAEIGLDSVAFRREFDTVSGAATERHIAASRQYLQKVGGSGFPTLVLETDGKFELLDFGTWLGNPQGFSQNLKDTLLPVAPVANAGGFFCTAAGCNLPD